MKRTRQAGGCPTGKVRYRDELAARIALSRIDVGVVRSYPCPDCRGWHHSSRRRGAGRTGGTLT